MPRGNGVPRGKGRGRMEKKGRRREKGRARRAQGALLPFSFSRRVFLHTSTQRHTSGNAQPQLLQSSDSLSNRPLLAQTVLFCSALRKRTRSPVLHSQLLPAACTGCATPSLPKSDRSCARARARPPAECSEKKHTPHPGAGGSGGWLLRGQGARGKGCAWDPPHGGKVPRRQTKAASCPSL